MSIAPVKLVVQASEKKIVRTTFVEGVVIYAENYTTKEGSLPGVRIQVQGLPYDLRILKGSIKGAGNAGTLIGCTVRSEGVMREYQGKEYFNPKDLTVTRQSGIAKLASAGVSFDGSLD